MGEFFAGHFEVEVAVVFDGIAVSIEEGGVPVAYGFVILGAVVGDAEVAPCDVELAVIASHHDEGRF